MRATAGTNALSNEAEIAKVQEWLGHANVSTNALDHQADIAKVQEWLGRSNIATTRLYDHRKTRPEDSPTFHVKY